MRWGSPYFDQKLEPKHPPIEPKETKIIRRAGMKIRIATSKKRLINQKNVNFKVPILAKIIEEKRYYFINIKIPKLLMNVIITWILIIMWHYNVNYPELDS